ncbi:Beta-xylosidase [Pleurostoma richardsiae]|uniref:Beta-xylosidase n=1 Tax=Pleurostoma richardsiae TaxID=41990 RepID=A0AA38R8T4_9PEZI|nr:Beta-xylosidase [Pleurostoma richardsiae]
MLNLAALALLSLANLVLASSIAQRSVSGTAVVSFNERKGTPQNLASGILYGIPHNGSQIPSEYFTGINFKYQRAGGTHVDGGGWLGSLEGYKSRIDSTLANYQTTLHYGGKFILLVTDIWGRDGSQEDNSYNPGNNGNWTDYDNFLTQLISDIKTYGMTENLIIDLWNEPDLSWSWTAGVNQYLELWGRSYYRFKAEFPDVPISGPSYATAPSTSSSWWTEWVSFIAGNGSVPEQYTWHMESGGGDMQSSVAAYKELLSENGLATDAEININEYAVASEQVPSASAWWISQLERVDAWGLRGIWQPAYNVMDLMAWLISKPGAGSESTYDATATDYYPVGDWHVYNYYAQNMTGTRVATSPTSDLLGEVYAVVGTDKVRLLVGTRLATGTFYLELNDLEAVGLASEGSLTIRTIGFPGSSDHYAYVDSPKDLGTSTHAYWSGSLTVGIYPQDTLTAYALEFDIPASTSRYRKL